MAPADTAGAQPRRRPARGPGLQRVLAGAAALLAVVGIRATVVAPTLISSDSMAPTLERGQVVLVDRFGGRGADRGDLVAFAAPDDGRDTIKRVVAVAGQSVMIRDAVLEVDGAPVAEPYVDHESVDALFTPLLVVPEGHVYLMGDARANSRDSRSYGPVPLDAIRGEVLLAVPLLRLG